MQRERLAIQLSFLVVWESVTGLHGRVGTEVLYPNWWSTVVMRQTLLPARTRVEDLQVRTHPRVARGRGLPEGPPIYRFSLIVMRTL